MDVSNLSLHEIGPVNCLAGYDDSDHRFIFVLRRQNKQSDRYKLHRIKVTTTSETLQKILHVRPNIAREITDAILSTMPPEQVTATLSECTKATRKTD